MNKICFCGERMAKWRDKCKERNDIETLLENEREIAIEHDHYCERLVHEGEGKLTPFQLKALTSGLASFVYTNHPPLNLFFKENNEKQKLDSNSKVK